MTINVLPTPEGWFKKNATALLDLLWVATLVTTFAFAAILALTLAVSLAADAHLIKIPDRLCYSESPTGGGPLICN
jgi:hypothetical protein